MRRSKRLRGSGEEAAAYVPPSRDDQQKLSSLLERLPKDIFNSVLCPKLEVPDLVLLLRANKFLHHRVMAAGGFLSAKRHFAAEHRGWTYANMSDETALKRIEALVAKRENCLACGAKCKGVHWPKEWRDGRFNLCSQMCMDCFARRNPRVKLLKASTADSKFGLTPAKRQDLAYVEWNRGFHSRRRMYLESDLLEAAGKKQKTKK
jgi:hypothetical protein